MNNDNSKLLNQSCKLIGEARKMLREMDGEGFTSEEKEMFQELINHLGEARMITLKLG
jgi:hypothetical protein